MTNIFQIEMTVCAIMILLTVIHVARKNKGEVRQMKLWFLISLLLLAFAIFPNLANSLSTLLRFKTTSNFLIFSAIVILLVLVLAQHIQIIKMQGQIKTLIQKISILNIDKDNSRKKD